MKTSTPNIWSAALGVSLALGLSWGTYGLCASLAQPTRASARLAHIQRSADHVDEAQRAFGNISAYRRHAVCHEQPADAGNALRLQIMAAAAGAGVPNPSVTISPPDAVDITSRLSPVLFELDATGGYDQVISLLRQLSGAQPQIFADTLDLKSETSAVSVKLTGRILCSPGQT